MHIHKYFNPIFFIAATVVVRDDEGSTAARIDSSTNLTSSENLSSEALKTVSDATFYSSQTPSSMPNVTIFKDQFVVTNKTNLTPDYERGDNETINRSKITGHMKLNGDQNLEMKMDTNGMVIESTPKTIKFSNTNRSDSKHKVDVNIHVEGPSVADAQDGMESSKIGTIATIGISNSHRELSNDLINNDIDNDTSPNNLTADTPAVFIRAPIEARHSVLSDEEDNLEEIMVKDIEKSSTQNAFESDQTETEGTIIVEPPFRPCRNEINCHQRTSKSLLS